MQGPELSDTAGEMGRCAQCDAATLRNSLIVSQKAEHRTIWPRNFPLAIYPGEIKTRLHKRHVYKCSSSIMHDSQKVETQTSISWWMDQEKWCHGAQPHCKQARRGEGVIDDLLVLVTLFSLWVGVHGGKVEGSPLRQRISPAQTLWSTRECMTEGFQRGKVRGEKLPGGRGWVAVGSLTS